MLVENGGERVVIEGILHPALQRSQPRFQRVRVGGGTDRSANRQRRVQGGLLAEKPDGEAPLVGDGPTVRVDQAGHDPEEGALAGTVLADQGHAVPGLQLERDSVEDLIAAVGMDDVGGLDKQGHGAPHGTESGDVWRLCPHRSTRLRRWSAGQTVSRKREKGC